jgi:hypothetical protein
MRKFRVRTTHLVLSFMVFACCAVGQYSVSASPFGQGVFGANVPFGATTSLSIALGGNVTLGLTPSGGNFTGSASNAVTVTSTDVIGYRLYAYSPTSTTMTLVGGGDTIPASANSSPAALATNTWGYNTTGSTTSFIGMLTTPSLIKDGVGPFKSGDITTVTYGAQTSSTKSAGAYTVGIVYTAAAKNP